MCFPVSAFRTIRTSTPARRASSFCVIPSRSQAVRIRAGNPSRSGTSPGPRTSGELLASEPDEPSARVRERVVTARSVQSARGTSNALLTNRELREHVALDAAGPQRVAHRTVRSNRLLRGTAGHGFTRDSPNGRPLPTSR